MPTSEKHINTILKHYGIDYTDDVKVHNFFETLQDNFTDDDIETIGDFILAAESSNFNINAELHKLPLRKR